MSDFKWITVYQSTLFSIVKQYMHSNYFNQIYSVLIEYQIEKFDFQVEILLKRFSTYHQFNNMDLIFGFITRLKF